jgi:6-pyruvoyltetrahydropterin/6-carboxytetrahydropterin synthase
MEVTVSRKAHFNAAHRLHVNSWTDEKNAQFFGLCNNKNFHGHNYELVVSVTGNIDPVSGYFMDMKLLKDIIDREILERFDHKNLNLDVPFLKGILPSTENLAIIFWDLIKERLPRGQLHQIRLFETDRNWVEYRGPLS